jgi:UrcA family protein
MHKPTIILAALALLAPAAAQAADHAARVGNSSYNVRFDDLDMKTLEGRSQALARIEAAAVELCKTAGVRSARNACVTKTVEAAAAQRGGSAIGVALAERDAAQSKAALAKRDAAGSAWLTASGEAATRP